MVELENELVAVAMQIILHAGDSRLNISKALECAKKFDFEKAAGFMQEAEEMITKAHQSQTEIIQNEAGGQSYQYSLLFTHAQDTLMTVHSEVRLSKEMIDILKMIQDKNK